MSSVLPEEVNRDLAAREVLRVLCGRGARALSGCGSALLDKATGLWVAPWEPALQQVDALPPPPRWPFLVWEIEMVSASVPQLLEVGDVSRI